MKPDDRYEWLERHMRSNHMLNRGGADVLDRDFVDAYIEATDASHRETMYGAYKCPQLGRDLATMVKMGILRRRRTGVEGMAGMGFPRWVWSYRLTHS